MGRRPPGAAVVDRIYRTTLLNSPQYNWWPIRNPFLNTSPVLKSIVDRLTMPTQSFFFGQWYPRINVFILELGRIYVSQTQQQQHRLVSRPAVLLPQPLNQQQFYPRRHPLTKIQSHCVLQRTEECSKWRSLGSKAILCSLSLELPCTNMLNQSPFSYSPVQVNKKIFLLIKCLTLNFENWLFVKGFSKNGRAWPNP